ncbi:MAG: V-type ATP synthase subunit I [Nanoarchaeota archaeon]|nr:V-type ATP synthase subunit I [Nanoarchaeota archaeon]
MLKEMSKLRIIGPKSVLASAIDKLYELKILHVVEHGVHGLEQGKPFASAEQLSAALIKARAIASQLGIAETEDLSKKPNQRMLSEIDTLAVKLETLQQGHKAAQERAETAERQLEKLELLSALGIEPRQLREYLTLEWFVGTVETSAGLKEALSGRKARFLLHTAKNGKDDLIALFVDRKQVGDVRGVLAQRDFSSLDLKDLLGQDTHAVKKILAEAKAGVKRSEEEKAALKKSYAFTLPVAIRSLHEELAKAEAPMRFQETEQLFVVHGFVPVAELESTMTSLRKATKERLHFEVLPIDPHHDKAPALMSNPQGVKSFEFFLNLYTLPKYREIDPSWILFFTFPLLYGFMLGDVGYGAVCLILFLIMKKKMPQFAGFFNILIFSSVSTMIFGAIFGEYFGFEFYHPLINRSPEHDLNPLMIAAVFAGIVHVNAGLVAGFINELKAHGFKTAFMEKFGWFFLQGAVALLGLSYAKVLPISAWWGYSLLAVSVVVLYLGEGARGIVEIPGIFGNILSYLRLMAIGLSSVGLALVINELAAGFFASGGAMIAVGILILAAGHALNIGIGIMGSFLHALRLHYVEHFSKFYRGGGITFKPFGAK